MIDVNIEGVFYGIATVTQIMERQQVGHTSMLDIGLESVPQSIVEQTLLF